ncbi:uncharacterized protein A1O9_00919 [Exophiala aquamarina CBS 119918]|uniref:Uncharacterized protein n=1 Tax=Exophiala aquamarina CBS 119918 TaxID=1182545 RepID=A0A072Q4V7_9EURO|nr:uncharacterized protein A1O9_00919 [Exophiala aquamarina CBS 119918]KEF62945.1 hypothetical protein A1O9_00919 [Exophiala aquamarina CBS 119918]
MAFFTSLFSCCASQSVSEKAEAEIRHARIVSAVQQHNATVSRPRSRPQSRRYQDSPPEYGDIAHHPLITIDEKNAADFDVFAYDDYVTEDEDESNSLPPSISPNSSVISIPSTRLTDLTSIPTGETISALGRPSLDRYPSRSTRPPSYYNSPRRTPSPDLSVVRDGDEARDEVWLHPVMQSNWLDVLQQHAARRAAGSNERSTGNR